MKKILEYKSYFINFFCAFCTYLAFLIYFGMILEESSFNFMMTLLLFVFFVFYNKENPNFSKWDKRSKIIVNIYSLFLGAILTIGSIVYSYIDSYGVGIFGVKNSLYAIVGTLGLAFLFRILIMKILKFKININDSSAKLKFSKKAFIGSMLIMVLCWLPYFLRYYPAIMTPDSFYSINYVTNGILSDHHTFGHTWFFGFFYLIGKSIFATSNGAVAFYIIIQMFINAFIFTNIIKFLYERGVNKIILVIVSLFLCFSPLYAFYSITLWRDILFGCSFVLMFISLYEFVENGYKFRVGSLINYIIAILFILFFRNNGIYVFMFFIPFLVIFSKKRRAVLAMSHIAVVIIYFVIKGPVFDHFEVRKSIESEAYSIPLQQIARVVSLDLEIDKESYDYLSTIINVEQAGNNYKTYISDPVKRMVDSEKLSETKGEFFKTWFKLLIAHPKTYIESYLSQTLGYWYPDVVYWATGGEGRSLFGDDVYCDPILKEYLDVLDHTTSRRLPLSNLIWSLGTMFIIFSFAIMVLIYKKEYRYLLCYAPLFCLWATLMVASPVFCELRYFYGFFTCITLILICPFIKKKKEIVSK